MNADGRVIVWFSCGANSAVAAKLALRKYPDAVIAYCDLLESESDDNPRFLADVEGWLGKKIELLHSTEYANIDEVFERRKYMSGIAGAPCTREMKKVPRLNFQLPNDLHIFGLALDEKKRIADFETNNPDLEFEWVLRDEGFKKADCHTILRWEGIRLPLLYAQGFRNNNCLGCVKATSAVYWDRVRRFYPAVFLKRCVQSRKIGCKLVRYHGVRIFLDELPDPITDKAKEQDIECGVICVQEINLNPPLAKNS
jgi:hypothetical protein